MLSSDEIYKRLNILKTLVESRKDRFPDYGGECVAQIDNWIDNDVNSSEIMLKANDMYKEWTDARLDKIRV